MLKLDSKSKPKSNSLNSKEMLYYDLETILKQMLIVWAKQSIALQNISGKKSGKLNCNCICIDYQPKISSIFRSIESGRIRIIYLLYGLLMFNL